jgi:ABC-type polysaccharide/polyol phosphate transport system ATPase subunit
MAALNGDRSAVIQTDDRPIAIEVRDLHKAFRIPTVKVSTLKERALGAFRGQDHRTLKALDGISFDVAEGEFFGVLGRNGSGKSTLLKLLASIYRADAGRIRVAGRLAPFIELGVGFNPELTARTNVTLNGVMMGLSPREARRRFDQVLDFAELGEFADLKLKNYSTGMLVRLGFSLMVQIEADVLLIDEVLAVGDAAFQLKCLDAFARMHERGTTIVLVTHDTGIVSRHCDRALLIEGGRIVIGGDPDDVSRRYLEINYEHRDSIRDAEDVPLTGGGEPAVEFLEARLGGPDGEPVRNLEQGSPLAIGIRFRALRRIGAPTMGLQIVNPEGLPVVAPDSAEIAPGSAIEPGEEVQVTTRVDNRLAPGHYFVHCIVGSSEEGVVVAFRKQALDFVVFGTKPVVGLVDLENESTVTRAGAEIEVEP